MKLYMSVVSPSINNDHPHDKVIHGHSKEEQPHIDAIYRVLEVFLFLKELNHLELQTTFNDGSFNFII